MKMLFGSLDSSHPGELIGAFDFILNLAEKVEMTLVLEIYRSSGT